MASVTPRNLAITMASSFGVIRLCGAKKLEAEKAEQQREFDNKRKAEQAKEKRKELPPALQDYLKKRESEIEMYKTISPDLNPYYKILVDSYYRALKGEK